MFNRKALLRICIPLAVTLMLPAHAFCADWLQVESTLPGETDYLDRSSIRAEKDMITFWARNIDRKGETTETRYTINCRNGTGAIKDIVLHGADDTIINTYSYKKGKAPWGKITARSSLRPFQKLLCKP